MSVRSAKTNTSKDSSEGNYLPGNHVLKRLSVTWRAYGHVLWSEGEKRHRDMMKRRSESLGTRDPGLVKTRPQLAKVGSDWLVIRCKLEDQARADVRRQQPNRAQKAGDLEDVALGARTVPSSA